MFKRINRRLNEYAGLLALVALGLVVAGLGTAAANGLITGSQIKNGTISSADLKNNGVETKDIANNGVKSADIGTGQVESSDIENEGIKSPDIENEAVEGEDLGLPLPVTFSQDSPQGALVNGESFSLVDSVGVYKKQEPTSALKVEWNGTAVEGQESINHFPCVFELRVNGQPTSGGEVLVSQTASVDVTALFKGIGAGPQQIEVWARHTANGAPTSCVVGPAGPSIQQSFIVTEEVG